MGRSSEDYGKILYNGTSESRKMRFSEDRRKRIVKTNNKNG